MKRRYFYGLLAGISVLALAACAKSTGQPEMNSAAVNEEKEAVSDKEEQAGKADGETYTIRIALVSSDSHLHNTVLKEWAEEAEEKTNGRLILKVMGSSQLGGERDYVEGMQLGNIEMAQVSSAAVNGFLNDFSILSFPYFFKDYEEMEKVFSGPMGQELFQELDGIGIKGLTWFSNGFRSVYTKDRAVEKPADMKGMKIRVMESDVMIATLNAMGASGTPMAYGELYSAIQQGVMDGAENALGNIYADGYYEICKNVSLTEHFAPPGVVAISKKAYESLPKDLQDYLTESAVRFGKEERKRDEELQKEMQKKLEDAGVEINQVDKQAFIDATAFLYKEYSGEISSSIKEIASKELGKSFE